MKTKNLLAGKSIVKSLRFAFPVISMLILSVIVNAQIYEPEGLNMPGAWDSWTNPPTNLALASSTQVTGGRVTKIATGSPRWQTVLNVQATGGDLTEGTYEWLFTSGPATNYYQNKWADVQVIVDSLQNYTKAGAANNSITLVNGYWYTMNWEDQGYADTRAIFMKTSAIPVTIASVSVPASVAPNSAATIDIGLSAAKCAEEKIFVRYTTDAWTTSAVSLATFSGNAGTASIPGQPTGTVVEYYAFSTTVATVSEDFDLVTINLNNNSGTNYTYTVGGSAPAITFANLQYPATGSVYPSQDFLVYGQAFIPGVTGQATPAPGLLAWVGYSTDNTNPSTWTNWMVADYNAPSGNNDEFKTNLGSTLLAPGVYYYATRFQLNADPYVYGGYSATGGGFWDGVTNVSGILDVIVGVPETGKMQVAVYPNPTTGPIAIDIQTPSSVRILDNYGRVVSSKYFQPGQQSYDLTSLPAGIYIVEIISGTSAMHQTLVKR